MLWPDCVDHNKQWKILKDMGIPDHLACIMRNLYAGQEAMELDWFKIGKGVQQGSTRWYIVTLLINLYAKYMVRNARLGESQTGIKIAGKNINNPQYADDTTLMAESEEELKSP